jgi:hypothetical protein
MTASARTLLTGLSAAAFCFPIAGASAQQINIHLVFDQEFDQVWPASKLVWQVIQVNATLNPHGQMNATSIFSTDPRRKKKNWRSESHEESELRLGASSENEWKVVAKDKLINIVDFFSFKRAILLTVNGSTCTAVVDFELKPGFSDYEYKQKNGSFGVAKSVTARRLNCSVGSSTGPS